ncbi:serine hydrolase domain-containing protein [Urechidicola vernalis]|uniref:Serine hydrolase domain-containing protein n=1 Tax=Urechidicola vernalis TaxID=3075600 RepID=A0ABU2Y4B7_9FLAO|nr:serine hydrolase domain-containing protein [Urechidicola sp. P050]MDT0553038.1 serine hydrolase domain-containing protein [Urechidicola sp. P050]
MNKTIFLFSLITIFQFGVFNLSAQQKTESTSLFSKIDLYLATGSKNGFSGAVSVVKNGEIIINKGYGKANKDTQTLNNPNTIFDIGSNTKQFTSTAILKLVELNKLNVTDSLSKYFTELPIDKRNITIHQLLTHTAGFSESIGRDFSDISQKDFFEKLFESKLLSEPGEKYSYSNAGYSILGRIIELASAQSYEAFLKEHLFLPAGMLQTGYLLPKWDTKQMSHGYNRNIIEMEPTITRYQADGDVNWNLKANGGINSTQNDMLLWYKALKTNIILTPKSFKKLTTPYQNTSSSESTSSYGYGWGVKKLENSSKRITHNGSNGTYWHTLIWYPKEDIFIVYATNANSSKVEGIAYVVAKIILDESYAPEPIKNNAYSFAMDYINQHSTDKSNALLALLQENYADDFRNGGLLNTLGNLLLRFNENLDWALEFFKMNIQLYPEDGNLWDSLGDGYKVNNLKEDAIKSYQKAIELGYEDSQEKLSELVKN